jgi:hypothetical protein
LLLGNVRGGDGAGWVGAFLPVDPGGAGGVDVGVDGGPETSGAVDVFAYRLTLKVMG